MTQTQDALARAIEHLGAIQIDETHYAYRETPGGCWYVSDAANIILLTAYIDAEGKDIASISKQIIGVGQGYTLWCSDHAAAELPAWWTPETRFAIRAQDFNRFGKPVTYHPFPSADEAKCIAKIQDGPCTVVTVNYETGEEVVA